MTDPDLDAVPNLSSRRVGAERLYRRMVSLPELIDRPLGTLRRRVLHPLAHHGAVATVAFARQVLRYAYVGGDDASRLGFGHFGERSMLQQPYALLMGHPGIQIRDDTLISPGATLAASPEFDWRPGDPAVIAIGSRVWAARGLSVVAHRRVEIGDDVWFGPNVYLTDASHDASDPDMPIGHRMEAARPVRVGDGAWIGTGVVVLPGVTIGSRVVVGANSVVVDDLPDNCVAVGSPARVIRELDKS